MKRALAVFAICLYLVGICSAADQQLIGLMMPDAKVLAGVNISQFLSSPFGQLLLSQIPTNDPNFQQFQQATGFDPTHSISQIVAASQGVPGQQSGLVAVRGTFDLAHIMEFLKSAGFKTDKSAGVAVYTGPDGNGAFAFLDSTLAVAGDAASVTSAVGRLANPSLLDPVLLAKADSLSGTQDLWVVSTAAMPATGAPPELPGGLNMAALQNIQQASLGVKFGTSITLSAEAVEDTPQNANALADIVRMGVSLAQMNQGNPQSAQLGEVLKGLSISTQGTTLKMTLSIPLDLLQQFSPAGKKPVKRAELK